MTRSNKIHSECVHLIFLGFFSNTFIAANIFYDIYFTVTLFSSGGGNKAVNTPCNALNTQTKVFYALKSWPDISSLSV